MAYPHRPTVSIGLPVYNGENFLADALESLIGQTYGDFEIIVSDNASTDATEEIVRRYMADDERIRYYRNDHNLGANPNYNRTFALARGEYFRWHAHDDRCDAKYLELCIDLLERDPSVSLVHCKTAYIDRNGDPLIPLRNGFLDPDGFIERLVQDDDAVPMLASPSPHVRLDAVANHLSVFFDIFKENLEFALKRETDPISIDVTAHTHVFGRMSGAWVFDACAEIARNSDVWIGTRGEIAAHVRKTFR